MSTNLSHFCDIKLATQVHGGFAPKPPKVFSKGNDIIYLTVQAEEPMTVKGNGRLMSPIALLLT